MTAEALARRLHAGQVDKLGEPYVGHLARVVAILRRRWPDASAAEVEAAWLHDAIEDTGANAADLLAAGISPAAVAIVERLTRPPGSDYLDWIRDLAAAGDRSVLRVKLADNEDNRDPGRVARLPGGAAGVATRYGPARDILEAALNRDDL